MLKPELSPYFNTRFDRDPEAFDKEMMIATDLTEQDVSDLYQRTLVDDILHASKSVEENGIRKANYSGLRLSVAYGIACGLAKVINVTEYRLEVQFLGNTYVFVKGGN